MISKRALTTLYLEYNEYAQEIYNLSKYKRLAGTIGDQTGNSVMLADRIWRVLDSKWIVVKDRYAKRAEDVDTEATLTDAEKMMIILCAE